ncbi:MAG: hypothetical protein QM831_42100 [Kofleriaceae bacterium]
MKAIDLETLATVTGGMQWQRYCYSYNVEDRRPGAGTPAQQRRRVDEWNRQAGCPVPPHR